MFLKKSIAIRIGGALSISALTFGITACASELPEAANTDEIISEEVTEEPEKNNVQQVEADVLETNEDAAPEIDPPSENQFQQTIKNLRYQYEPALGADVYFPAAGGQLPDGVGISLQLVFVDYDDYFLQLRVLKGPTGDFDIQALNITSDGENVEFLFSPSQLFDAYIYDELTYEIGEYPLSPEEEAFFVSLLSNKESSWKFIGASGIVESEFDRLSILGIGTVLRFKQGLDEGYEIPEGLAQPLM